MPSVVERQERREIWTFAPLFANPKPLILVSGKPYRNKSYTVIGWTGPKLKGIVTRRG